METTYKVGDVFRIVVQNKVVRYYKNNILIYQSQVPDSTPLVAAASVLDLGGTVSGGVISTSSSEAPPNTPVRALVVTPDTTALRSFKR
jgi:hypothetical protein